MFEKFFYYMTTLAEAGLAVVGINGLYEQPPYQVRQDLGAGLEIRDYGPVTAIETTTSGQDAANRAFRQLFAYITGTNESGRTIAMTVPVRMDAAPAQGMTMRFFLPSGQAPDPPRPVDGTVRVVKLPAATVAALRFSGNPDATAQRERTRELLARLETSQWRKTSEPYLLSYDPPFTIPFLKHNEIAVSVSSR